MSECEHDWAHMSTRRWTDESRDGYNIHWVRVDEFFCRKCLARKDTRRYDYSRDTPDWYGEVKQ